MVASVGRLMFVEGTIMLGAGLREQGNWLRIVFCL